MLPRHTVWSDSGGDGGGHVAVILTGVLGSGRGDV